VGAHLLAATHSNVSPSALVLANPALHFEQSAFSGPVQVSQFSKQASQVLDSKFS
jgi:hypothetical protein